MINYDIIHVMVTALQHIYIYIYIVQVMQAGTMFYIHERMPGGGDFYSGYAMPKSLVIS